MACLGHSSARAALIYQNASEERERGIATGLDDLVRRAAVSHGGMSERRNGRSPLASEDPRVVRIEDAQAG